MTTTTNALTRAGWMTKDEVAAYIGVTSGRTVDRWISKRIIPRGRRFPCGTYWRKDIIDKWLASAEYEKQCDEALRQRMVLP